METETRQTQTTGAEQHVKGKFLPAQRVCYDKPTLEKKELPTAVHEKIIPSERIEIQPVLHREREQLEIRHIQQPMKEHLIHATEVKEETLPTKDIGEFREESFEKPRTLEQSRVQVLPMGRETIRLPPVVEERVHKKVVEEIQPVIYRETEQPHIIRRTQPVTEKVVEAPVVLTEVLPTKDLGSHYVEKKLAPALEGTSLIGKEMPQTTEGLQAGGWQYKGGTQFGGEQQYKGGFGEQQYKGGVQFGGEQQYKGGTQFGTEQYKGGEQFGGEQYGGMQEGQYGSTMGEETRKLNVIMEGGTTVPTGKQGI